MANQIKHNATEIVNASSVLKKEALADSGVTAAAYAGSNTHVPSLTVDTMI